MNDSLKICLLVVATLAGTLFSVWRSGASRDWVSALALLGIAVLLAFRGDHPLRADSPFIVWLALTIGLAFGLSFPCCTPSARLGPMAIAGAVVVVAHCLLDGHVVREVNTLPLLGMFSLHKFVDGADGRILSLNSTRATLLARIALALATPVGFFMIPAGATPPIVHMALFSAVIGFNVGTAFHVIRHGFHVRALHRPASTSSH
jgi:hypothetical protein